MLGGRQLQAGGVNAGVVDPRCSCRGALRLGFANPYAPQSGSGSAHRTAIRRGKARMRLPPSDSPQPEVCGSSLFVSRGLRVQQPEAAAALAALLLGLRSLKPKALFGFFRRLMRRKAAPIRPARSPAPGSHRTYDLRRKVVVCASVFLRPRSHFFPLHFALYGLYLALVL